MDENDQETYISDGALEIRDKDIISKLPSLGGQKLFSELSVMLGEFDEPLIDELVAVYPSADNDWMSDTVDWWTLLHLVHKDNGLIAKARATVSAPREDGFHDGYHELGEVELSLHQFDGEWKVTSGDLTLSDDLVDDDGKPIQIAFCCPTCGQDDVAPLFRGLPDPAAEKALAGEVIWAGCEILEDAQVAVFGCRACGAWWGPLRL
jgi:hypothetical protein